MSLYPFLSVLSGPRPRGLLAHGVLIFQITIAFDSIPTAAISPESNKHRLFIGPSAVNEDAITAFSSSTTRSPTVNEVRPPAFLASIKCIWCLSSLAIRTKKRESAENTPKARSLPPATVTSRRRELGSSKFQKHAVAGEGAVSIAHPPHGRPPSGRPTRLTRQSIRRGHRTSSFPSMRQCQPPHLPIPLPPPEYIVSYRRR